MTIYPPAQDAVAVLGPVVGEDAARALSFDEHGLLCAVVQQHDTLEVLMVAWMDAEALRRTLTTRRATYWTRSRGEYWVKGDTSGHTQAVLDVRHDCDGDSILLLVDQVGAACHTGTRSCYDPTRSLLPASPAT